LIIVPVSPGGWCGSRCDFGTRLLYASGYSSGVFWVFY